MATTEQVDTKMRSLDLYDILLVENLAFMTQQLPIDKETETEKLLAEIQSTDSLWMHKKITKRHKHIDDRMIHTSFAYHPKADVVHMHIYFDAKEIGCILGIPIELTLAEFVKLVPIVAKCISNYDAIAVDDLKDGERLKALNDYKSLNSARS